MSFIMGPIGSERLELFALELEKNATFDIVYSLASTIINPSAPNLVKVYMTIRSRISSITGIIGSERLELFALELKKNAIFDFVYTLASTIINQTWSNYT